MAKKVLKQVSFIRDSVPKVINYEFEKSISYSQTVAYNTCPHFWALDRIKGLKPFRPSIHTVFGTSLHEVLQEWLTVLYTETAIKAGKMDLEGLLQQKLSTIYAKEKESFGQHFTTAEELSSFYEDGVEILRFIRRKRAVYFSTKNVHLVGVEIPLIYPLAPNIFFKGFIDVLLYDSDLDTYTILDIKTSTSGWNAYAKKDDKKLAQLLLYKDFLAKQFNLDVDKVDVKYFIVKRRVPADPEFPAMGKRVQEFIPPSGKAKRNQALAALDIFIKDAFTEQGQYIEKEYEKRPSKSNCIFCDFKGTEYCTVGVF